MGISAMMRLRDRMTLEDPMLHWAKSISFELLLMSVYSFLRKNFEAFNLSIQPKNKQK